MNTKFLMAASALVMGITGIIFTFLPQEIITFAGYPLNYPAVLLIQILGAIYFAFALLNWMAKGNLIGGIYSKPVAMGNFTHFFIGSATLIKYVFTQQTVLALWIAVTIYSLFAIAFGMVAFGNPLKK